MNALEISLCESTWKDRDAMVDWSSAFFSRSQMTWSNEFIYVRLCSTFSFQFDCVLFVRVSVDQSSQDENNIFAVALSHWLGLENTSCVCVREFSVSWSLFIIFIVLGNCDMIIRAAIINMFIVFSLCSFCIFQCWSIWTKSKQHICSCALSVFMCLRSRVFCVLMAEFCTLKVVDRLSWPEWGMSLRAQNVLNIELRKIIILIESATLSSRFIGQSFPIFDVHDCIQITIQLLLCFMRQALSLLSQIELLHSWRDVILLLSLLHIAFINVLVQCAQTSEELAAEWTFLVDLNI